MNKKIGIALIPLVLLIGSTHVSAGAVEWIRERLWGFSEVIELILDAIKPIMEDFIKFLLGFITGFLTWNPDVSMVRPLIDDFIEILTPLYIIAFLITGIYFFFLSESPKGRAKARSALLKLLLSIAFVLSATTIYQFLLDLSEMLVNFVLDLMVIDLSPTGVMIAGFVISMPIFWVIYATILIIQFIIFGIRYVLLLIMAAIFPLTIFFFFFEPTKNYGRKLMRYTLALIFTPVTQAIVLVFWVTTMNNIGAVSGAGNFAMLAIALAGFVLMIIAPWITLGLLKWVGGMFAIAGFMCMDMGRMKAAMGFITLGGLMMGEGPGAIPLGMTMGFIGGLERRSAALTYRYRDHGMIPGGVGGHGEGGGRPRRGPRGGPRGGPHEGTGTGEHPGSGEHKAGLPKEVRRDVWAGKNRGEVIKSSDKLMSEGYEMGKKGLSYKEKFEMARGGYESVLNSPDLINESSLTPRERAQKAEIYAKLGEANEQLRNTEAAKKNYKKAMELNPEKPEYAIKYADISYRRG